MLSELFLFIFTFRFLKDNPKQVNKCHTFGWAPIHVAAVNNKYQQIEVLLKCGADPDIGEGFSNYYNVSRKKNVHPNESKYFIKTMPLNRLNLQA